MKLKITIILPCALIFSSLVMCTGLEKSDYKLISNRNVVPLIKSGSSLDIKNKYGILKIYSESEQVRLLDWGDGVREIHLKKIDWGRASFDEIINPLRSGYISSGAGFIGSGSITRVVYGEETLIFKSEKERDAYMDYPFNKSYYDMKKYPNGLAAGFSIERSRDQITVQIYRLEAEREMNPRANQMNPRANQ